MALRRVLEGLRPAERGSERSSTTSRIVVEFESDTTMGAPGFTIGASDKTARYPSAGSSEFRLPRKHAKQRRPRCGLPIAQNV
jgi:hypothetical protein